MTGEHPVNHRNGPLTLRLDDGEVTLTGSDANALIDAIEAWRQSLKQRLAEHEHDRPERLEVTARSIDTLARLEDLLATTPSRLSDPPLELDQEQANHVLQTLNELSGYQRGELSPGLTELRRAVERP
jgi:hypothetical protein